MVGGECHYFRGRRYRLSVVVLHEMVHLPERRHNERFREHMDRLMPQWQLYRDQLNRAPLAHEAWEL